MFMYVIITGSFPLCSVLVSDFQYSHFIRSSNFIHSTNRIGCCSLSFLIFHARKQNQNRKSYSRMKIVEILELTVWKGNETIEYSSNGELDSWYKLGCIWGVRCQLSVLMQPFDSSIACNSKWEIDCTQSFPFTRTQRHKWSIQHQSFHCYLIAIQVMINV